MKSQATHEEYVERFWSHVKVNNSDNKCWEWTKARLSGSGYGIFGYKGKNILTHRFAYEFANGEGSAEGKIIRHTCDNPPCCNPFHLIDGTYKDNTDDMFERGRARRLKGDECSWKKLTEKDALEIRKLCNMKSIVELAKMFNVNETTIADIKYRRSWKDIGKDIVFDRTNKKDTRTYIKELLGRKTLDGVVIHYVDGNRDNKVNSNMVVCPSHAYHELLRQRKNAYEACGHADWIKCTYCKQYDTQSNMLQKKGKTEYRPDETFYRFHKDCQLQFQRKLRKTG